MPPGDNRQALERAGATLQVWTNSRERTRTATNTRSRLPSKKLRNSMKLPAIRAPFAPYKNIVHAVISTVRRRIQPTASATESREHRSNGTSHKSSKLAKRTDAAGRGRTRPFVWLKQRAKSIERRGRPVREQTRTDAADNRYLTQLENDNEFLRSQIERKDKQIEARDSQIQAMIERDRETNVLIHQLQERIPQLARPEWKPDAELIPHDDVYGEASNQG